MHHLIIMYYTTIGILYKSRRSHGGSYDFLVTLCSWVGKKGKVVPVLNLIKHYALKAYGGVDV
jgi:hypothetical protein